MPNRSYSVLFMRDDADVKTLRVSPKRLKLLLWTLAGAAVVVFVLLVLGLRSFVGYRTLVSERRDLEVKLAEAQVSLERLGNLDKLQHGAPAKADKPDAKADARPDARTDKSGHRAFQRQDKGTIAVDNLRGQLSGSTLTISFDLNNRAQGSAAGAITLLLLKSDGSLTELEASNPADLTYQIQRFKRISASARVPEKTIRKEALGLRMEIKNSDGELILGETYALGG